MGACCPLICTAPAAMCFNQINCCLHPGSLASFGYPAPKPASQPATGGQGDSVPQAEPSRGSKATKSEAEEAKKARDEAIDGFKKLAQLDISGKWGNVLTFHPHAS